MSRSEVNQTTAKASLTQMLNVVFQRMEAGSQQVHVAPIVVSDVLGLPPVDTSSVSAFVQSFLHEVCLLPPVYTVLQCHHAHEINMSDQCCIHTFICNTRRHVWGLTSGRTTEQQAPSSLVRFESIQCICPVFVLPPAAAEASMCSSTS